MFSSLIQSILYHWRLMLLAYSPLPCFMLQDRRESGSRNVAQKQRGGWEKTGKLGLKTFFNVIQVFQPLVYHILKFSLEKRFFWKRAGYSGRTEVPPSLFPPFSPACLFRSSTQTESSLEPGAGYGLLRETFLLLFFRSSK